jgi:hypothetical protein
VAATAHRSNIQLRLTARDTLSDRGTLNAGTS